MTDLPKLGAAVEFKPAASLGGWRKGAVTAHLEGGRKIAVKERGKRGCVHIVPARRVRLLAEQPAAPTPFRATPHPAHLRNIGGPGRSTNVAIGKRAPIRAADYLAWVRTHACCVCSAPGPTDAHHYGPRGLGSKTDDVRTVPLDRACHDDFHNRGAFVRNPALATPRDAREHLLKVQVDLLCAWFALQEAM